MLKQHKFAMHQKVQINVMIGAIRYTENGTIIQQIKKGLFESLFGFDYLVALDKAWNQVEPIFLGGMQYNFCCPYCEDELEAA